MTRRGLVSVVVLALVVVGLTPLGLPGVAAQESQVSVESVSVSPETVVGGEPFRVTATIRNAQSSDSAARITQVSIQVDNDLTRHDDLGTIGAGESMDVPFSLQIDEPGRYELTLRVNGQDVADSGSFFLRYPVYVTVEEASVDVGMTMSTADAVQHDESRVNVTVANGDDDAISSLELVVAGPAATVDDGRRVVPTLAPGAERTFAFDVRFAEAGAQPLTARLDYRTAEGYDRRLDESATIDVEPLRIDAEVSAVARQDGNDRILEATIENFGNVALEDVVVRVERDGELLERVPAPDVAPEDTGAVSIDAEDFPAARLTVTAAFEAADRPASASTQLDYTPGVETRIELTGIDAVRRGSVLTISGDAANVGEAVANAVVLRVVSADGVTPVNPHREFFVGSIDPSEFATFELTASVSGDRESLPVEVLFTVDGERRSSVINVDVGAVSEEPTNGSGGRGPLGLAGAAIGLVVVGAAAFGVYRWRQRR